MQTNYTILVWANKSKKNSENKAPIYARLTVNGRRAEISLNEKIDLKLWDAKFHKAKGSTNIARRINLKIDKAISKLNTICEDIIREGELLTPSLAKSKFLGNHIKHETLDQLIGYHQEKMANFLKPGTLKNYYTTRKYLDKYIKEKLKTSDIYIKQVNYKFMIDFEDYLRNQKGLNNNGVMKHLERLKKLMNLAEDLEWIKKNPVKRYKLRFEEVDTDYLTKEELSKLINTEFKKKTLKQVKDVFVFACYTGLAYSDLKKLSVDEINIGIDGNKWIYTRRKKTNSAIRIPLLKLPLEIIQKYKDHPRIKDTDLLLPVFTNQKMNQYLKEIATELKFNKKLSSHVARHTFATTVTLANGVPIESVSKLLGHTKISTTQIYARIIDTKLSDDFKKIKEITKTNNAKIS